MISDAVEPWPKWPSTPSATPSAFPAPSRATYLAEPDTGRDREVILLLRIARLLAFDVAYPLIFDEEVWC